MSLSLNGSADPRLISDKSVHSLFQTFVDPILESIPTPTLNPNETNFNSSSISTLLYNFIQFQHEHLGLDSNSSSSPSSSSIHPNRIPSNCLRPFKSLQDPNSPASTTHQSPIFTLLTSLYSFLNDRGEKVFDIRDQGKKALYKEAVVAVTQKLKENGHINQIVISPVKEGLFTKAEEHKFSTMANALGCE